MTRSAVELSPHTGWTRRHWAALADQLLTSVRPHASERHARILLPGPAYASRPQVDGLEGFARTFLLAAFRPCGEPGEDPLGLAEWYAAGVSAGTDPESPERWLRLDEHPQAKVEAASIALALDMTRPWIWDRLDPEVQQHLVDYFAAAVGDETSPEQLGLVPARRPDISPVGRRPPRPRGDGGRPCDERLVHPRRRVVGRRNRPILRPLRRVGAALLPDPVGADGWSGRPGRQPQARRCGTARPIPAGRRAVGRCRRRSAHPGPESRLPVRCRRTVLGGRDGWRPIHHAWPAAPGGLGHRAALRRSRRTERRRAPGSRLVPGVGTVAAVVLRVGVALLGLERHARARAAGDPPGLDGDGGTAARRGTGPDVRGAGAGLVVSATHNDGIVRIANHGTDHDVEGSTRGDSPLYARLGYSTATSPCLDAASWESPLDQSVVLMDRHDRATHRAGMRTLTARVDVTDDGPVGVAASTGWLHWVTPAAEQQQQHGSGVAGEALAAGRVTIASLVRGPWEVRLARVDELGPRPDSEHRATALRVGGWTVSGAGSPTIGRNTDGATITVDGVSSSIWALTPDGSASTTTTVDATPLGPVAVTPWVVFPVTVKAWVAVVVELSRPPAPSMSQRTPCAVGIGDDAALDALTVTWPDGVRTQLTCPVLPAGSDRAQKTDTCTWS